jgi:hypothetical protein
MRSRTESSSCRTSSLQTSIRARSVGMKDSLFEACRGHGACVAQLACYFQHMPVYGVVH